MKKVFSALWEIIKIAVIALIIVIPIREFVFQPFFVKGASMEPNFHDFDYLIIDELSYNLGEPGRGDVVVFRNPVKRHQRFIKRIIGLPGETVKIVDKRVEIITEEGSFILDESSYLPLGTVTNNEGTTKLGEKEYYVMGDNRPYSYDSRYFGSVSKEDIIGRVAFKFWPLSVFAKDR